MALPEIPDGAGGIATTIGLVVAGLLGGWRYFVTTRPSDANAAANSSAQIAAIATYEKMLKAEQEARTVDASRAATELQAVRDAWAKDVATRSADYLAERAARLASDKQRDEVMTELWTLRGQVKALTEQLATMQTTVTRLQELIDGKS